LCLGYPISCIGRLILYNQEAQPGGNLTISIGVAEQTKELNGNEELVKIADEALYKSKKSGRNRVTLAGEN